MKRLIGIIAFALTLPLFSVAQSNYKPGYVVTVKGDTLKGFVNYKEWPQNPLYIDFKANISDKAAQKLTPDDINTFNITGFESYQKFTGIIGMDYIDRNHISNGNDSAFRVASVFLKVLAEGKNVVLLTYVDDIRSHFYIEEAPGFAINELVYHIHNQNDPQTGTVKTIVDNDYINQLYFLAQKYNVMTASLQQDMVRMDYYADDFVKIVNKINGITQTGDASHSGGSKIRFFAGLGVDVTNSVPTNDFRPLGATNYTSVAPFVSGGFNLPVNANIEKVILRCELTVGGMHYYTSYNDRVAPYLPVVYKYSAISVAFTPQILYSFYNTDELKVFGGIGFSFSYYSYMKASYTQKNGDPVPYNSANPYYFVTFSTPIVFKAGIRLHKRIEIYTSYLTGTPVSNDEVFRLSFASLRTGVNYYFN